RLKSGDLAGAEAAARRALRTDATAAVAHLVIGRVALVRGDLAAARTALERALVLDPTLDAARAALAEIAQRSGRPEEAIGLYRAALARHAQSPQLLHALGTALIERGDFDDAADALRQALDLAPGLTAARESLSRALFNARRFDAAEAVERELLAGEPDAVRLHLRLAHALLQQGKLDQGWTEYEWRLRKTGFTRGVRGLARWDGAEASGRTILVVSEQGLGDAILFARFVPELAGSGARVHFLCRPKLERLFRSSFQSDAIRVTADTAGEIADVDAHIHLLSLPHALRATAPERRSGYLRVESSLAHAWRARLAAYPGLKVGLAWAGNTQRSGDESRSLAHEILAPLRGAAPGATWFNLQAELDASSPRPFPMVDWMSEVENYADTAALIDALDLVVSVDTSVAHAAAALGKPLWLLAPHNVCWRWEIAGVESPWYPDVRMFRAQKPHAWGPVIESVRLALQAPVVPPRR
ncbi:MAG: tetratricopeptide repeat protein, partial [Burkholderiales bacterium]